MDNVSTDEYIQNNYTPEYLLARDAFVGPRRGEIFESKLKYLAEFAKEEQWNFYDAKYKTNSEYPILNNYLFFTYDRLKAEGKIVISEDKRMMCFNTGLQSREREEDIFAVFEPNVGRPENSKQEWRLKKFCLPNDGLLAGLKQLPEIAEYWLDPAELLFDKRLDIRIRYDHIVKDNIQRFKDIGADQPMNVLEALLATQANKAIEKVKRNYKVAIPQFYTNKFKGESKIQLMLPLCIIDPKKADLALVISKETGTYIGRTIFPLDWAYMNSRRIITPDADWIRNI